MINIYGMEHFCNEGNIKYRFYEFAGNKYCDWTGKYTSGLIGIRGTRLYLKKTAATCFDADFEDQYDRSEHDVNKFWDSLDQLEFPGDYCQLRCYNLENLINEIECASDSKFNRKCKYINIDEIDAALLKYM